jgi:carbon storage regulator CsrA
MRKVQGHWSSVTNHFTEEPMLILGRKVDQAILIGEGDQQVRVLIVRIRGDEVRIGIDAPKEVPIVREELEERK